MNWFLFLNVPSTLISLCNFICHLEKQHTKCICIANWSLIFGCNCNLYWKLHTGNVYLLKFILTQNLHLIKSTQIHPNTPIYLHTSCPPLTTGCLATIQNYRTFQGLLTTQIQCFNSCLPPQSCDHISVLCNWPGLTAICSITWSLKLQSFLQETDV